MARIDIDKISKVEKHIERQEIVKATFSVSNVDDNDSVFQIDTYTGVENGADLITQSIQFDTKNLGKFLDLVSSQYESFSIPLLDDYGEVKYGLNWGNRTGRNINQAYLDLPKSIYDSDFFPTNGIPFYIRTDDNRKIKFTRAQKDNVNGHAIQTPDDNAIVGIYLRNRLSISPGKVITKEAIESYGRDYITVSKIGGFYYLDFSSPKKKIITTICPTSLQQIYYGAPGTGKSHKIKKQTEGESVIRTTFHPDSDYSTFVGAYKPTTREVELRDVSGHKIVENGSVVREERIIYEFVGQAFLQAYVKAWKLYAENPEEPAKQYLVVEEINRGNCAQIFGDLFQLLDRNDYGFSDYPIAADSDLNKHLKKELSGLTLSNADSINSMYNGRDVASELLNGKILLLPNNLYIWATMNTSDQSLFPIDSAFKRRWEWKYVPINTHKESWSIAVNGKHYSWSSFLDKVNKEIDDTTHSEDKKLGFYFCKADNGVISSDRFVGKVLFYLYNDVFKDYAFARDFFKDDSNQIIPFQKFFNCSDGSTNDHAVEKILNNLNVELLSALTDEQEAIAESITEDLLDEDGNTSATGSFDRSKYSINGIGTYGKGNVAYEVMKLYVENNPQKSASEIVNDWLALGVTKVPNIVETESAYETRRQTTTDTHFDNRAKSVTLANGQKIYVSREYNPERIAEVMTKINAANWGITIRKL